MSVESAESERRFPRRFLIAASGAAVATGAVQAITSPASAADGATTWKLGGNAAVSGDGSNFIGPLNAAPLIFKTRLGTGVLTERMRIGQNGHVSVGVPSTTAQFGVRTAEATAAAGTSTNASSSATGVQGTADSGAGVRGNSVDNYGVFGTGGYSRGPRPGWHLRLHLSLAPPSAPTVPDPTTASTAPAAPTACTAEAPRTVSTAAARPECSGPGRRTECQARPRT